MNVKGGYLATATAFDRIAPDYDEVYGQHGSFLMHKIRGESLRLLDETFPPGSNLLEIGCGTGEEAIALAGAGRYVLATDLSPRMVALAAAKVKQAGLENRVTTLAIPAGDLGALKPGEPFDGAYASFGSLNCEPALEDVIDALSEQILPGGSFVCTVMARWCPMEILWHLAHLRPRQAFRRAHGGWQLAGIKGAGAEREQVLVRYYSAREIAKIFAPNFKLERIISLPLLLPPVYMHEFYRKYRPLFNRLESWEIKLRERWPWNGFGDHLALVFRNVADA